MQSAYLCLGCAYGSYILLYSFNHTWFHPKKFLLNGPLVFFVLFYLIFLWFHIFASCLWQVVIFNQVTTKCTEGSFQLSLALGRFCSRLSPIFNPQFSLSISYILYHLASLRVFVSFYFLGDSWSHSCTNRVILYWNGDERNAYIDKSPSLRSASASFSVTNKGIRNSASNHKRIKLM